MTPAAVLLAGALLLVPAEVNGRGRPARWEGEGRAYTVVENANAGTTFSLLLGSAAFPADGRISARIEPLGGIEDAGGGVVLRARDAGGGSHYVCRWNPLEENLRLYAVERGVRRVLATKIVRVAPGTAHEVALSAEADRLVCVFDGSPMIDVRDGSLSGPGRAGVWVKADARTAFTDIGFGPPAAPLPR